MDLNRRSFLRMLGLAPAAAIIKPKKYWFFGGSEMWKPDPLWTTSDKLIVGMDMGNPAGDLSVWTARLGKWYSGPKAMGETILLPDGTSFGLDARGAYIQTWRAVADTSVDTAITIMYESKG